MSISSLHVRVDRFIQDRRSILESAMQSAVLLKEISKIKALNKQKKSKVDAFQKNLKELSNLMGNFKLEEINKQKKAVKKIRTQSRIEAPKEKSGIERDLDDIREKLQRLNF